MDEYGLYLHIPFCQHRCAYCDFNTYAGLEHLITEYVEALCREVKYLSAYTQDQIFVRTIFFGGGTPSLLPEQQVEKILANIHDRFVVSAAAEITLEANPGTVNLAYLRNLSSLGINRLSFGMQSAHFAELQMLERTHGNVDVVNGVQWARMAGIENINLDLMFGLPDQSVETWEKSLRMACKLEPSHFSLYALTLEHGTPMQAWVARGLMSKPDSDVAAEMYELGSEFMQTHGYQQYEISNWAKWEEGKGLLSCQHNLQYWRNLAYLGLGAGAHGYANNMRVANVLAPAQYISKMSLSNERRNPADVPQDFPKTPATSNINPVNKETEMGETMMMGLRLVQEGVSQETFFNRFGVALVDVYGPEIKILLQQGLLEWQGDILRLTAHGRLLGNQVFLKFI
ncbi:MAG: radical SAM family heme chaperone HemW [Anaerolineales bacterium]|nr:MAG: radical SAM family heme chaperone HemW [Anaerolineales bacterium]